MLEIKNLNIKGESGTFFVPEVSFDASTGECKIAGESYLEDAYEFYRPLKEWLEDYTKKVRQPINFTFRLTYYNTSSSKCLLELLKILSEYQRAGGDAKVQWLYPEEDDDLFEEAEDFKLSSGAVLTIVPY